jgi:hypothetical protein
MNWGKSEEKRLAKVGEAILVGMETDKFERPYGKQLLKLVRQVAKDGAGGKVEEANKNLEWLEKLMKKENCM